MKISLRFSILSILLALLIGTSLCVVGINHFFLDKILLETSKESMDYAGGKVSEQVARYLEPLEQRSYIGASLIEENIITPSSSFSFINFLHSFISNNTNISAVYWADVLGNFYLLESKEDGTFFNRIVLNSDGEGKVLENVYDSNMSLLESRESLDLGFDPRLHPWYQHAKFKKEYSWSVYPMRHHAGMHTHKAELAITASYPIYNESGNLRGIFGVDIPLEAISAFVKSIELTENSIIFICDNDGRLFSAYSKDSSLLEGYKMPKINDIGLDWITLSFKLYKHKSGNNIFIFDYGNKEYIANYEPIQGIRVENWSVGIVTPVQDIIAPLQKSIRFSFILVFIALIFCVILAARLSSYVSKPIIKLAKDAELICQLRLDDVKQLFSRIKEIDYVAKRFIKMRNALHSFQRYLPMGLVKNLILRGEVAEVGGEMKEITMFFSDIENFTAISENMPPADVMEYLSEYLQVVTKVILNSKGVIDKYLGDGVMALWGTPIDDSDHALHACQAALDIKRELKKLNEKWRGEGRPAVSTRIGISTDRVVVGNVGSDDRLNYTALGDGVNLASRLENLNKSYGSYLMVSEHTHAIVKDKFEFRLIDKVAVKGKVRGVYVYELLREKDGAESVELKEHNECFRKAFSLYESGKWQEAHDLFSELFNKHRDDMLLKIFINRCEEFMKNPPKDWDGTWVMYEK